MGLESDIFCRRVPVAAALNEYGFTCTPDGWVLEKDLLAGAFRARVAVREGVPVSGDVFDTETGEPYLPLRVERQVGAFTAEVRKAYAALLEDIAAKCFREKRFLADQTERVSARVLAQWGDEPVSPFEKHPETVAYRDARSGKWYGLIVPVAAGKLRAGAKAESPKPAEKSDPLYGTDPKRTVEIINLKAEPEKIGALCRTPGIYPAYHMNKKHWISVLMDGPVPDDRVMQLLADSHRLACRGGGKSGGAADLADGVFVIPSAYDQFDVAAAFRESPYLDWQQAARMRAGDTVYIYVGVPVKAIRYRCTVTETDIPNHSGYREDRYPFLVMLHLEEIYGDDVMPLSKMRELGLSGVRGARRVPRKLAAYMRSLGDGESPCRHG